MAVTPVSAETSLMTTTLSRRRAAKLIAGAALAAVPMAGLARDASAGRAWCRMDPEFDINGEILHVYLSADERINKHVSGPSIVTLFVPNSANARFIWADEGFGGLGYDVRIEYVDWLDIDPDSGKVSIEVETYTPAKEKYQILAEAVHEKHSNNKEIWEQKKGITNKAIRVKAKV
jgi:hypothetical protein